MVPAFLALVSLLVARSPRCLHKARVPSHFQFSLSCIPFAITLKSVLLPNPRKVTTLFFSKKQSNFQSAKMKYSVAAATLVALASAQSLGDIPSCAVPCLGDAASAAGCDESDIACLCKNVETIQMQAASCVIEECGQDKALSTSFSIQPRP